MEGRANENRGREGGERYGRQNGDPVKTEERGEREGKGKVEEEGRRLEGRARKDRQKEGKGKEGEGREKEGMERRVEEGRIKDK